MGYPGVSQRLGIGLSTVYIEGRRKRINIKIAGQ